MKKNNNYYFTLLNAMFLLALLAIIYSCSNNEPVSSNKINTELTIIEKNEIVNSTEFEEYIEINIKLYVELNKLTSLSKNLKTGEYIKTCVAPNGQSYKTFPTNIAIKLFEIFTTKSEALNKKYPLFKKTTYNEMIKMVNQKVLGSESLNKILVKEGIVSIKSQNIRQKTGGVEDNNTQTFNNSWEAFLHAIMYSMISQNECSGFVLADGSVILFINPDATHGSTSYPVGTYVNQIPGFQVTFYNGQIVVATFHTHFNSSLFSTSSTTGSNGNDQSVQSNNFPNSSLIILYNGNAYQYNFQYGYYMP